MWYLTITDKHDNVTKQKLDVRNNTMSAMLDFANQCCVSIQACHLPSTELSLWYNDKFFGSFYGTMRRNLGY